MTPPAVEQSKTSRSIRSPSTAGLPESLMRAITSPGQPAAEDAPRGGGGRQQRGTPVAEGDLVDTFYQLTNPELASLRADVARLEAAKARLEMAVNRVMVSQAMPAPRETRVLPRGNWMDDSGTVVDPAIPEFLGVLPTGGRRATRLDLANWLVSPQNPLTARVFVNRTWRQFFGTGLSAALGDFGSQGEWPSHPDLLDWLAAEFMEPTVDRQSGAHGWDMKHLVRTIVTSHTYRQSSMPRPEAESKDPVELLLREGKITEEEVRQSSDAQFRRVLPGRRSRHSGNDDRQPAAASVRRRAPAVHGRRLGEFERH